MASVATVGVERNPEAELIHWMLRSRSAREVAVADLADQDFSSMLLSALFRAIRELHAAGAVIDPASVARRAKARAETVIAIYDLRPFGTDLQLIGEVRDASGRRYLRRASETLLGRLTANDSLGRVNECCEQIARGLPSAADRWVAETFEEMEARVGDTSYRWLVPWVLERDERLLLVGIEGSGKSVLLRQMGYMLACGCHWVTGNLIPPARVLVIDAENPDVKLVRGSRWMHHKAAFWGGRQQPWDESNFRTKTMPSLDLVSHRAHRDNVADLLERYRPDLLIIGPLYKVGRNTKASYEESALAMTDLLDDWRERYGCAVLMEHHAPKTVGANGERQMDPKGSSVWMSWPDLGIKLRHIPARDEIGEQHRCPQLRTHFHVGTLRGSRGTHHFPEMFRYGDRRRDEWPWVAEGFDARVYDHDGHDDAVF